MTKSATGTKLNDTVISNREDKKKKAGVKIGDTHAGNPATKTDSPEFIKSEQLMLQYPFTIYGGREQRGRFGERIHFNVAWLNGDGEKIKRVWTPTANDDRRDLLLTVRQHGALINCRLIAIPTGGEFDYWKVVDADIDVDKYIAENSAERRGEPTDDDIPFA